MEIVMDIEECRLCGNEISLDLMEEGYEYCEECNVFIEIELSNESAR